MQNDVSPKGIVRHAISLLSVPHNNPLLSLSQFEAFSKQVPLLYFILMTNMAALAWTHRLAAPTWLVVVVPSVFSLLFIIRTFGWVLNRRKKVTPEQAYRRLRTTNIIAGPIAASCTAWSLALLPYGDAHLQAHVAFFMAITVIGIIFCLMHLRSAALIVSVVVNVPFLIGMLVLGEPTFIATGVNVALVTMAMIAILMTHYRDFRQLNEQRQVLLAQREALHEQNRAMQSLSDDNFRLANLDSLTLLANRRSFFHFLEIAFDQARSTTGRLAVGVIDLDGFKPINDMYGHAAGDKVLVEVGQRLNALAGNGVTIFRLGGDEFAILFIGDCKAADLLAQGQVMCDVIAGPINVGSGMVQVTGSLGIAIYPEVGSSGQDLYERADYALYAAKRFQRAGVVIFNKAQAESLDRQKRVEEVLLAADLDAELSMAFQPIFEVATNQAVGFEALARWTSPVLGCVSPAEFVPIAEHNGRVSLITRKLLGLALDEARFWPQPIYLSFNLSAHDIATPESILRIVAIVEKSGFDPCRINFEITETAVIRDLEQAACALKLLQRMGCGVALDDFGTGYASLNHVHRLPLSKIKIDGCFVTDVDQRPASAQIIRTMLSLCSELGLGTIVEGVETEQELSLLKSIGVQFVQGFHFSRPLSPEAARNLLATRALSEPAAIAG
jgi:diguanylate cyclase (GGDEF)-like protein